MPSDSTIENQTGKIGGMLSNTELGDMKDERPNDANKKSVSLKLKLIVIQLLIERKRKS